MLPHAGPRARGYVLLEAKSRDARRLRGEHGRNRTRSSTTGEPHTPDADFAAAWRLAWCLVSGKLAGHMFYLNKKSRAELAADVRKFFEGSYGVAQ